MTFLLADPRVALTLADLHQRDLRRSASPGPRRWARRRHDHLTPTRPVPGQAGVREPGITAIPALSIPLGIPEPRREQEQPSSARLSA